MCSETFQSTTEVASSSSPPSSSPLINILQTNSSISTIYGIGQILEYRSKDQVYKIQLSFGILYSTSYTIDTGSYDKNETSDEEEDEVLASFVKEELDINENNHEEDEEYDEDEILTPGSIIETVYGSGIFQECRLDNSAVTPVYVVKLSFGVMYMPKCQFNSINNKESQQKAGKDKASTTSPQHQVVINELLRKKKQLPCTICEKRLSHWNKLVKVYKARRFGNQKQSKVTNALIDKIMHCKPRKGQPCLLCGAPTCKKHSSPDFRKEGNNMTVCEDCTKIFSFKFVLDIVRGSPEIQQANLQQMMETYNRTVTLLRYSLQIVNDLATALEQMENNDNRMSLGCSSIGFLSGLFGVAAAVTLFTPVAPVMTPTFVSAAFLTSSSSTAVSTHVQIQHHFSLANRLANRIIVLHGMCLSIQRIRNILERLAKGQSATQKEKDICKDDVVDEGGDMSVRLINEETRLDVTICTKKNNGKGEIISERRRRKFLFLYYTILHQQQQRQLRLPPQVHTPTIRLPNTSTLLEGFAEKEIKRRKPVKKSTGFQRWISNQVVSSMRLLPGSSPSKKRIKDENNTRNKDKRNDVTPSKNNRNLNNALLNLFAVQLSAMNNNTHTKNGRMSKNTSCSKIVPERKQIVSKSENKTQPKHARSNTNQQVPLFARMLANQHSNLNALRRRQKTLEDMKIMDLAKIVHPSSSTTALSSEEDTATPKTTANKIMTTSSTSTTVVKTDTTTTNDVESLDRLKGKYATYVTRTCANAATSIAQSLEGALNMLDLVSLTGGTMSFYVLIYEARSIKTTIDSIQKGDPCEKAKLLRSIARQQQQQQQRNGDEGHCVLSPFPQTLEQDCHQFIQLLNDRSETYEINEIIEAIADLPDIQEESEKMSHNMNGDDVMSQI